MEFLVIGGGGGGAGVGVFLFFGFLGGGGGGGGGLNPTRPTARSVPDHALTKDPKVA
jgi:hypothetical protein